MEQLESYSPLDRLVPIKTNAVRINASVWQGKLILRGNPSESFFPKAIKKITGKDLPKNNNSFVETSSGIIIWMGPNEWMWCFEDINQAEEYESAFRKIFAKNYASCCNVSDYYLSMHIVGGNARKLLQKECSLNFSASHFKPGQCAQSLFSEIPLMIICRKEQYFDLYVRWSYAGYLWAFLEESALWLKGHSTV